jgi:lipopolysaccharide/colanic/teichoic acid biosynthesis glycosyltransferase
MLPKRNGPDGSSLDCAVSPHVNQPVIMSTSNCVAGERARRFQQRFRSSSVCHDSHVKSPRTAKIGRSERLKRFIDVSVSLTGLILLIPLFLVVAACIKLTDGGPVLFWQMRVGRAGREFWFPKLRSMVMHAETLTEQLRCFNAHGASGITFKMRGDPRVTWIGRIIRRTSIDELPQLWCVLKGEMSLVGPRPPVPREVARYSPKDHRRLDVTPGLTCFWQVNGRGEIPFDRQVEMDLEYIQRRNLLVDLRILLKTIPAVIIGRGAF